MFYAMEYPFANLGLLSWPCSLLELFLIEKTAAAKISVCYQHCSHTSSKTHPCTSCLEEIELSPSWNQKTIQPLMFNFSEPAIQEKLWHVVRKVLFGGNLLVLYQYISPIVPSLVPCIISFSRRFWLDSLSVILYNLLMWNMSECCLFWCVGI